MDFLLIFIISISIYMVLHNFFVIPYLKILGYLKKKPSARSENNNLKKISIIIPAFNEEKGIYEKMLNVLDCTKYFNKPFEVLIGSDGSTDSTCKIVKSFIKEKRLTNWKIFEFENKGKGQTINKLVGKSKGDVIISTDADVVTESTSFQEMVNSFEVDRNIGCLSCIPIFKVEQVKSHKLYWHHDIRIREAESRIGMLIVVTGWLYGFRKSLFRNIPYGVMADDLWTPLSILLQNYKSVHNQDVKVISEKTDEITEIKRRKRVIIGGIDVIKRLFLELMRMPNLLFIVFSHKINRWLLPLWVFIIIAATTLLSKLFILVYAFILLILAVWLSPKRLLHLIYAFLSPILAVKQIVTENDFSKWGHTRK